MTDLAPTSDDLAGTAEIESDGVFHEEMPIFAKNAAPADVTARPSDDAQTETTDENHVSDPNVTEVGHDLTINDDEHGGDSALTAGIDTDEASNTAPTTNPGTFGLHTSSESIGDAFEPSTGARSEPEVTVAPPEVAGDETSRAPELAAMAKAIVAATEEIARAGKEAEEAFSQAMSTANESRWLVTDDRLRGAYTIGVQLLTDEALYLECCRKEHWEGIPGRRPKPGAQANSMLFAVARCFPEAKRACRSNYAAALMTLSRRGVTPEQVADELRRKDKNGRSGIDVLAEAERQHRAETPATGTVTEPVERELVTDNSSEGMQTPTPTPMPDAPGLSLSPEAAERLTGREAFVIVHEGKIVVSAEIDRYVPLTA